MCRSAITLKCPCDVKKSLKQRITQIPIMIKDTTMSTENASGKQVHQVSNSDNQVEIEHLFRNAPVGLAFLDRDLRYVRINQRLADINGKPISEHIGRILGEVVPNIAETVEPLYRKVLRSGEPIVNREVQGETPADPGIKKHWLVNYYPVKSTDGVVIGVNTVVQDITKTKELELKLQNSGEQFRAFMDNNPAVAYIKNESGTHEYGNQTLCDVFQTSRDKFIGTTTKDFFPADITRIIEAHDSKVLSDENA